MGFLCSMKKTILSIIAIAVIGLFGCGQGNNTLVKYGEAVDTTKAQPADKAFAQYMQNNAEAAVISGQISQVCQGEGCWYMIKSGAVEQYVEFGNKFNIAKDCAGKQSVASGRFYRDTQSIEQQREGLSKEEAAKITAPKVDVHFRADGIIIH